MADTYQFTPENNGGKGRGGSFAFSGMLIFRDYVRFTPWETLCWLENGCPLRDVGTVFFFFFSEEESGMMGTFLVLHPGRLTF